MRAASRSSRALVEHFRRRESGVTLIGTGHAASPSSSRRWYRNGKTGKVAFGAVLLDIRTHLRILPTYPLRSTLERTAAAHNRRDVLTFVRPSFADERIAAGWRWHDRGTSASPLRTDIVAGTCYTCAPHATRGDTQLALARPTRWMNNRGPFWFAESCGLTPNGQRPSEHHHEACHPDTPDERARHRRPVV